MKKCEHLHVGTTDNPLAYECMDCGATASRYIGINPAPRKRFEIGTIEAGKFQPDTLGNNPEDTTFIDEARAIAECEYLIEKSPQMWGSRLRNAAVFDNRDWRIVWRQDFAEIGDRRRNENR